MRDSFALGGLAALLPFEPEEGEEEARNAAVAAAAGRAREPLSREPARARIGEARW